MPCLLHTSGVHTKWASMFKYDRLHSILLVYLLWAWVKIQKNGMMRKLEIYISDDQTIFWNWFSEIWKWRKYPSLCSYSVESIDCKWQNSLQIFNTHEYTVRCTKQLVVFNIKECSMTMSLHSLSLDAIKYLLCYKPREREKRVREKEKIDMCQ